MALSSRIIVRGCIQTLNAACPQVDKVVLQHGRVETFGPVNGKFAREIVLGADEFAVPVFADPHLHLLSSAAARVSLDCSGQPDMDSLLARVAKAAAVLPGDGWLRGTGFDDALIAERRYPSLAELDRAAAGRPVVLHHATGHAAILSSAALAYIDANDHEQGILVDRHDLLQRVPRLAASELQAGLAAFIAELNAAGVVAITDTTHTNDRDQLASLDRLLQNIATGLTITAMPGWDKLEGLEPGGRIGCIAVGPAKIMPADNICLTEAVACAHRQGFAVAIHAVDYETLEEALVALEQSPPPLGAFDRIEHCALALPEQLDRLARLPVQVVTQPSFVTRRAQKYREQLSEVEQQWLYPVAGLLARGVPLRFSSDSPVAPSRPLEWVSAARDRQLAPAEAVDTLTGLRLSAIGPLLPGGDGRLAVIGPDQTVVRVIGGCDDSAA